MRTRLFHFIYVSAAALALCCACAKEIEPSGMLDGPQPLVFTAGQADLTPGTRAAADGFWDGDGSEFVAIQIGTEVKKYKVTSSSGTLKPCDGGNTFYRTDKSDIAITAWYPYSSSRPSQPDIRTDQSTKTEREAGNLMTASATARFGETTELAFSHQAAIVRVSVIGGDGTTPVSGATVKILGNSSWITAYGEGGGSWSALVSPRTVSAGTEFIRITADGGNYVYKTSSETVFSAGRSYTYSLALEEPADWFYVEAAETVTGGVTVSMTCTNGPEISLLYSTDGSTWEKFEVGTTEVKLSSEGDKVRFKAGGGNTQLGSGYNKYNSFTFSGKVNIGGDLTTLLSASGGVSDLSSGGSANATYTFYKLFSDNTSLISAENLSLPSAMLADDCYRDLFSGCTSLTVVPELPATALATRCCFNMFKGCTSLKKAPTLSATVLASQCYQGMFSGCASLEAAPALPAKTLASQCYYEMFQDCIALETAQAIGAETFENQSCRAMFSGCTSLTAAPAMSSAKTLAVYCCSSMFQGCTSLQTAPALPATSLAESCYISMFSGCTNLISAPALPALELAESCYQGMFYGCTSLVSAPAISATKLAVQCYFHMFQNCTGLTAAPRLPITDLETKCYYGMFQGCTSLQTAPKLPAATLAESCYEQMFMGCTGLVSGPTLSSATTLATKCCTNMFQGCTKLSSQTMPSATTLAASCYNGMFSGCTNLKTAPELTATTLAENCYYGMFSGCTSLETVPELSVTNLENWCYQKMFSGCTSLKTAPELPATVLSVACYQEMFSGCTSLQTAPVLPATALANFCYQKMFSGCTSLKEVTIKAPSIKGYTDALKNWLSGVSSSGTVYYTNTNFINSVSTGSASGIPTGWEKKEATF